MVAQGRDVGRDGRDLRFEARADQRQRPALTGARDDEVFAVPFGPGHQVVHEARAAEEDAAEVVRVAALLALVRIVAQLRLAQLVVLLAREVQRVVVGVEGHRQEALRRKVRRGPVGGVTRGGDRQDARVLAFGGRDAEPAVLARAVDVGEADGVGRLLGGGLVVHLLELHVGGDRPHERLLLFPPGSEVIRLNARGLDLVHIKARADDVAVLGLDAVRRVGEAQAQDARLGEGALDDRRLLAKLALARGDLRRAVVGEDVVELAGRHGHVVVLDRDREDGLFAALVEAVGVVERPGDGEVVLGVDGDGEGQQQQPQRETLHGATPVIG